MIFEQLDNKRNRKDIISATNGSNWFYILNN